MLSFNGLIGSSVKLHKALTLTEGIYKTLVSILLSIWLYAFPVKLIKLINIASNDFRVGFSMPPFKLIKIKK